MSESAVNRRRRATAACDFCRRRKLRCDNTTPLCGNCEAHQRECIYAERVKQPRPSNSRIKRLEDQIAKLLEAGGRSHLVLTTTTPVTDSQIGDLNEAQQQWNTDDSSPSLPTPSTNLDSDRIEQDPVTRYGSAFSHGDTRETSDRLATAPPGRCYGSPRAMFDEQKCSLKKDGEHDFAQIDFHARSRLLAEAAKQRQLETINFKSGLLDFDGVEPAEAMVLLSVYWNRQCHGGPIVHRPSFMRDMACGGPRFSKPLLNAMYFSSAEFLYRAAAMTEHDASVAQRGPTSSDTCSRGWAFRQRVEDYLHDPNVRLLFKSNLLTVQTLLILSHTIFSWCDEKSASWHYAGLANNMIIDLGLHTTSVARPLALQDTSHGATDLEIHRRVFWSAFAIDKLQAVYQGRPTRLKEVETNIPILFMDEYEELEPFQTIGYTIDFLNLGVPSRGVSSFEQLCKLSIIMDRMICQLYSKTSPQKCPTELLHMSRQLDEDLRTWRSDLPSHLSELLQSPESADYLPHTISLMALFNAVIILLHRPFVSNSHLQSAGEGAATHSFTKCATAAAEIDILLRQYQRSFCMKSMPYPISYATYVSATIHLRIAAQHGPGSEAHCRLRRCFDVLATLRMLSHASEKCFRVLQNLTKRLGVNIDINPDMAMRTSNAGLVMLSDAENAVESGGIQQQRTVSSINHSSHHYQLITPPIEIEGCHPFESGLDLAWLELDMDEIRRSFDVDSGVSDGDWSPQAMKAPHGHGVGFGKAFNESLEEEAESSYCDALFGVGL